MVGYSFRDDHINHYLAKWINQESTRLMRIIDPCFEESAVPFASTLKSECRDRIEVEPVTVKEGRRVRALPAQRTPGEPNPSLQTLRVVVIHRISP